MPDSGFNDLDILLKGAEKAEEMLKILANRNRLVILCSLHGGEKSVGEIQKLLPLSQPLLSQHLAKMRQMGLLSTRREGQSIIYTLMSDEAKALLDVLSRLYCSKEENDS